MSNDRSDAWWGRALVPLLAMFLLLSEACYVAQGPAPLASDASQYLSLATDLPQHGMSDNANLGVRLYGYPVFLALFQPLVRLTGIGLAFWAFLAQTGAYLAVAAALSRRIGLAFPTLPASLVMAGLLSNLFVLPYLGLTLTDGLSTVLDLACVLVALTAMDDWRAGRLQRFHAGAFGLGLVFGFGVMVRPSSLFMAAPLAAFFAVLLPGRNRARPGLAAGALLLAAAGAGLVWVPELSYNIRQWHRVTVLPAFDLQSYQGSFAARYLKYGTLLTGNVASGIRYLNPWLEGEAAPGWFRAHPLAGAKTILMHLFGAVDFDYPFPYTDTRKPHYRLPLFMLSQSTVFWGLTGLADAARGCTRMLKTRDPRAREALALTAGGVALVAGWAAVFALTAVETRFSLPVMTVFLPLALWAVSWRAKARPAVKIAYGGFAVYLAVAWQLHGFLMHTRTFD